MRDILSHGDYMKTVLKSIIFILGSFITVNGISLFFTSNINIGHFLTVILGAIVVVTALVFERLSTLLRVLLISVICIAVILPTFLILYGKRDNVTYREDAVVVLGAGVRGTTPSRTLKSRLEKAVKYHTKNPDAVILVSGGQGPQEDITEAEAMRIYLVEHGVDPDKIIKEEKSTSTYENFNFSKEILDRHFTNNYNIAFITNDYHIFRSRLYAKQATFKNATHLHASTRLSYLLSGSLRECLTVIKYIVFKR